MVHVYTHIDLVLLVFMKSGTFCTKTSTFYEKHMKSNKNSWFNTQISHFDLVFHRVQREGQLGISYILVVFGGECGACMCKWYMYTHILTWSGFFFMKGGTFCMKSGVFYEKYVKSIENIWKATKTADSTQVSYFDLVFHRVKREGQLGICYILVIFGGACMCKWYMYTHILTWFLFVFIKSGTFCMKSGAFHEKYMKRTEKHLKNNKNTLIQHRSLILTWSFIEYRGKVN